MSDRIRNLWNGFMSLVTNTNTTSLSTTNGMEMSFLENVSTSDLVYTGIIAIMGLALILLWLDYRSLKSGQKRRKISDRLANPASNLPEVSNAFKEVAEMVIPTKSQRFRKRDRFYFHGRKLARSLRENMGSSARSKAIQRVTKNFLR